MGSDKWCLEELRIWTQFACAVTASSDEYTAEGAASQADKMLEQWRKRAANTMLLNPDISVLEYERAGFRDEASTKRTT